jgi:hypothetical protein
LREGFSPEGKAIAEELGGQPHEASWILTFLLSKASPGAFWSYLPQSFTFFMLANVLCTYLYDLNENVDALEWLPVLTVLNISFCSI